MKNKRYQITIVDQLTNETQTIECDEMVFAAFDDDDVETAELTLDVQTHRLESVIHELEAEFQEKREQFFEKVVH